MSLPVCGIRRHNHMPALSALGLAPKNPTFPAVIDCPNCQQSSLHLFDDIVTDGIWLYCRNCHTCGDIVTFGAQHWNLSIPATLTKFSELGVILKSEAARLEAGYVRANNRHQAAAHFWRETAAQLWNHGDDLMACRLRDFGAHQETGAGEDLIGVAHRDQIKTLCGDLGRSKPPVARKGGTSLVLPYYDLPGRLTGFLLVQFGTDLVPQQHFVNTSGYNRRKPDAGYFLLPAMLSGSPILKDKKFIIDDPLWVLKEQCRQLRYCGKLIPLAAWYRGDSAVSYGINWKSLGPASRIFHGRSLTPELVSQAATASGYVSTGELDLTYPKNKEYTLRCLNKLQLGVTTWPKAMHEELRDYSELNKHHFAAQLTAPHKKLQAFFTKYAGDFPPDFGSRILRNMAIAPGPPTRTNNKWILIEQENGWCDQRGQQVCNAKIVITKVIQLDSGEKFYAGKICMPDWELEFVDNAKKIERLGLLAYAASIAAPHKKLIIYDTNWNRRSHMLALQMYAPELIPISSKSGWDAEAGVFRFGNYSLTNSGAVDAAITGLPAIAKRAFPEPVAMAPIPIRNWLNPGQEAALVWNIFADIAAKLIAPMLNKDPVATAFSPAVFDTAATLGAALTCPHEQHHATTAAAAGKFIAAHTADVEWPLFLSGRFDDRLTNCNVPRLHHLPINLRLPAGSHGAALSYGWQRIHADKTPAPDNDFSIFQYVLPAYLQHVLKNRMLIGRRDPNLNVAVLRDLHEGLQDCYAQTFHLPAALAQLQTPDDAHTVVFRELIAGLHAGALDLIPRPRKKDQPWNYFLRRKADWWINQKAADRYFLQEKNIAPNWLAVINLIANNNLWRGEETVQQLPGFLVDAEWCDNLYHEIQAAAQETG